MQIKEESEVMEGLARIDGDLYEDIFFWPNLCYFPFHGCKEVYSH